MKNNTYKLVYQNIGCMAGGSNFPVESCKTLLTDESGNINCDIFAFVEYSEASSGEKDFESYAKSKGFILYKSTFQYGRNQVLIGVRDNIKVINFNGIGSVSPQKITGRGLRANAVKSDEVVTPDYLRVITELDGIPVDIIASRIPAYSYYDKNGRIMQKAYNCRLASFRQFLEALDRELSEYHNTVLVTDANNARFLGKFSDDYEEKVYRKVAQYRYNFPVVRSDIQARGLVLRETSKDYSFGPAHDDHCFSNMPLVQAKFFNQDGFDHSGIRINF